MAPPREMKSLLELPARDEGEGDRRFAMSLARGLEILRAFRPDEGPLGNTELSTRTGIPKPTISRLTYTLTKLGYLEYDPRLERYRLGAAVLALGYAFLSNLDLRKVARRHMQTLAEFALASVGLCSRDRLTMLYQDVRHATDLTGLRLDVGSRIPMESSAAGMAYLAGLQDFERQFVIDGLRTLQPESWPATEARIATALAEFRDRGFCSSKGGVYQDSIAVAVPFLSLDGATLLVFNCAAPMFILSEEKALNEVGPRLVDMAINVRTELVRSSHS